MWLKWPSSALEEDHVLQSEQTLIRTAKVLIKVASTEIGKTVAGLQNAYNVFNVEPAYTYDSLVNGLKFYTR